MTEAPTIPPFCAEGRGCQTTAPLLSASSIAVCSLYTPKIEAWAKPIAENNRAYAERHGYRWDGHSNELCPYRPPSWSKIVAIKELFRRPDPPEWVFWIDADAVVMNHTLRLEDLIMGSQSDLIIAEDTHNLTPIHGIVPFINCGVFAIRNTMASRDLLSRIWLNNAAFINHPWWEQASLIDLINRGDHNATIELRERTDFNCYVGIGEFRRGKFIAHMTGMDNATRTELTPKILADVIR